MALTDEDNVLDVYFDVRLVWGDQFNKEIEWSDIAKSGLYLAEFDYNHNGMVSPRSTPYCPEDYNFSFTSVWRSIYEDNQRKYNMFVGLGCTKNGTDPNLYNACGVNNYTQHYGLPSHVDSGAVDFHYVDLKCEYNKTKNICFESSVINTDHWYNGTAFDSNDAGTSAGYSYSCVPNTCGITWVKCYQCNADGTCLNGEFEITTERDKTAGITGFYLGFFENDVEGFMVMMIIFFAIGGLISVKAGNVLALPICLIMGLLVSWIMGILPDIFAITIIPIFILLLGWSVIRVYGNKNE